MTKFEGYLERRERERTEARNLAIDLELARSLATRTKEEVLEEMWSGLTIPLGVSETLERREEIKRTDYLVF